MDELEDGKLIETSSNKGNKCHMPARGNQNADIHTDRKQQAGCHGLREAWNGELVLMWTRFLSERWKTLQMDVDSSTTKCKDLVPLLCTLINALRW
jgi:hypothetical protein